MNQHLWHQCNRRFAAKMLSEFVFEQLLAYESKNDASFEIKIGQAVYAFNGMVNVWRQPLIDADSLVRIGQQHQDIPQPLDDCNVLFNDLAAIMPCDALIWSQYVYECLNTLYSDYRLALKQHETAPEQWLALSPAKLHTLSDGHPKALPNKGRINWGEEELAHFSPEAQQAFQLRWLAVHQSVGRFWPQTNENARSFYLHCMDDNTYRQQYHHLAQQGLNAEEYRLLPVHPWQWSHFISIQFRRLLAENLLVDLGISGDFYLPQPSLRTLSNITRPKMMDIKLPLTLLNTSSYRGLPECYLSIAAKLSQWLQTVCHQDALFQHGVRVQAEPYSAFVPHPFYSRQTGAPYQYQEMLGAVWRESAESKSDTGETVYMAAVLQQKLPDGQSMIGRLIQQSGLPVEEWLSRLFDVTAVPLWHWQCAYGLGFISHGQNLNIVFENHAPKAILLKDIQGDLFVSEHFPQPPSAALPPDIAAILPKMPPHYLIHNLWTGYFASVLRFSAGLLHQESLFSETAFWQLLAKRLRRYQEQHPQWQTAFDAYDLFQPMMPRLSINRARLASGYDNRAARPGHIRAEDIRNPLCL